MENELTIPNHNLLLVDNYFAYLKSNGYANKIGEVIEFALPF
jgi:hypothetical protein